MTGVRHTLAVLAAAAVFLVLGGWLRFSNLPDTPLHADEATGARLVGHALDDGRLRFDPAHFHGPLLHGLAAQFAQAAGSNGWRDLRIGPLRAVTATAGWLLCLLPLAAMPLLARINHKPSAATCGRPPGNALGSNRSSDSMFSYSLPALFATAFLALSPPLVHFSRVYIHESLLVLLLGLTLLLGAVWWRYPSAWTAAAVGALFALAAATKETFVITAASWVLAAALSGARPAVPPRVIIRHASLAMLAFAMILWISYAGFGRNPAGVLDFFRTYWTYEVTPGHEKPADYYLRLLLLPHTHGRLWWWMGGTFLLALAGCLPGGGRTASAIRFLVVAAVAQAVVYSLIAYKTPWLMVVPWAHVAAAAGLAAARFLAVESLPAKGAASLATLALLSADLAQSSRAVFRFPSDERNPFCYVPTAHRVGGWTARSVDWLQAAGVAQETVAVVGPHYWPLPWYLRSLPHVGYWQSPPDGMPAMPMIVAMPQVSAAVADALSPTHVMLPEGLRSDTPVLVFIRNDVWEHATGLPAESE